MQTKFDDFRALSSNLREESEYAQSKSSTEFDSEIGGCRFFKTSRSFAGAKIKSRNFVAFQS